MRKKRAEEEAAEDQRLMEEYKRKLEQEEVDRANAFKRRLDKLEATGSKWAEEGAGKEQMEVEKRLEAMVLREAAKKDAADEERERRDKAALKYNAKVRACKQRLCTRRCCHPHSFNAMSLKSHHALH